MRSSNGSTTNPCTLTPQVLGHDNNNNNRNEGDHHNTQQQNWGDNKNNGNGHQHHHHHTSTTATNTANERTPPNNKTNAKKKIRIMIITLGGQRMERLQNMFRNHQEQLQDQFELPPTFVMGVPSRKLRNRHDFLYYANQANLLPKEEWDALQQTILLEQQQHQQQMPQPSAGKNSYEHSQQFWDCLHHVPILSKDRQGSQLDQSIHYSIELWRKAKAINRGRNVFACTLAHLIHLQQFVNEEYDIMCEDNICFSITQSYQNIIHTINSSMQYEQQQTSTNHKCHLRYYGWLGSRPNLQWIYQSHIPRTAYTIYNPEQIKDVDETPINNNTSSSRGGEATICPFPTNQDVEQDLQKQQSEDGGTIVSVGITENHSDDGDDESNNDPTNQSTTIIDNQRKTTTIVTNKKKKKNKENTGGIHTDGSQPGGNMVWGAYAYWISKEAYEYILYKLQHDVGAMLWKGKRMRCYVVKPIDKILPRQILHQYGPTSIHVATHPSFFRAPMLTSKIHTKYDPEFCQSTTYQLQQIHMEWSELCLSSMEQQIVNHYKQYNEWITEQDLICLLATKREEENNI